jgi:hypothetical protein
LAAQWQDYYIFASCSGSAEYGRAPADLGAALDGKIQQAKKEWILWMVGTLICLLFAVITMLDYFTGRSYTYIISNAAFLGLLWGVWALTDLLVYFYRYRRIKWQQKQLLDGCPIDHEVSWRAAWWKNVLVQGAAVLMAIVLLAGLCAVTQEQSVVSWDAPRETIVRMADLEERPAGEFLGDSCERYTLLCPKYLNAHEKLLEQVPYPQLSTEYYELWFDCMARRVFRDLMSDRQYGLARQQPCEEGMLLYTTEQGGTKQVFLLSGRRVLMLSYTGEQSLQRLTELACQAIKEKQ